MFSSESHAKFMVSPLTILGKSNRYKENTIHKTKSLCTSVWIFFINCYDALIVIIQSVASLQLRVDGVLMRLRETRMHYVFGKGETPTVLRESCWRETTFKSLSAVSFSSLLGQITKFTPNLERLALADDRPNHVGSSNKYIMFL